MPHYKVERNIKASGAYRKPGEVVELDEAAAAPLLQSGAVSPVQAPEVAPQQAPLAPQAPANPPEPNGFPLPPQPVKGQPTAAQIQRDIDAI